MDSVNQAPSVPCQQVRTHTIFKHLSPTGRAGTRLRCVVAALLLALAPAALSHEPQQSEVDPLTMARNLATAAEAGSGDQRLADARKSVRLALQHLDYETGARMAALILEAVPGDIEGHQARAIAALGQRKPDEVLDSLRFLMTTGHPRAGAMALNILNHPEAREPRAELLKQLSLDPEVAKVPAEQGTLVPLALELKDYESAERMLDAALAAHPDSAKTWLWRALADVAQGDKEKALDSYSRAVKLDPDNESLRLAYAQALHETERSDQVEALLRAAPAPTADLLAARAAYANLAKNEAALDRLAADLRGEGDSNVQLEPAERDFLLGQLAELREQKDQARRYYEGISEGPRAQQAKLRLAVLTAPDNLDAALALLEPLRAQEDDLELSRNAHMVEAELLQDAGRHADAAEILSQGLSSFSDDDTMLYARALAYVMADQVDYALTDFRLLLSRQPDSSQVLNAYGYTLADHTDRLDEARDYIRRALEQEPEDPAILDSMGWVLFKQGDAKAALPYLERAFKGSPDPEIAAHLGEVLHVLDRKAEAREVWQKALKDPSPHPVLDATVRRLAPELIDAR